MKRKDRVLTAPTLSPKQFKIKWAQSLFDLSESQNYVEGRRVRGVLGGGVSQVNAALSAI